MKSGGRLSISVLLVLAVLAGTSGIAGCATCPSPARTVMPCCGSGGAPSLHAVSCCQPQASAPVSPPSQGLTPPTAPAALAAPAPADLPSQPAAAPQPAELPPAPPPLHEGIGLYTLNAAF